jgi:hypothetical protein
MFRTYWGGRFIQTFTDRKAFARSSGPKVPANASALAAEGSGMNGARPLAPFHDLALPLTLSGPASIFSLFAFAIIESVFICADLCPNNLSLVFMFV